MSGRASNWLWESTQTIPLVAFTRNDFAKTLVEHRSRNGYKSALAADVIHPKCEHNAIKSILLPPLFVFFRPGHKDLPIVREITKTGHRRDAD